jgi:hypothetical protein
MSINMFDNELKSILTTVQNSTDGTLEKNINSTINNNKQMWKSNFITIYNIIFTYFKNYVINEYNKADMKFNISKDVNDYINDFAGNKITYISDTTKKDIKYILVDYFENNKSKRALAYDLRQLYSGFNKSRSKTIARTEVAGISNYSMLMGAVEAGYSKKKWIPILDAVTRDSHEFMADYKSIDLLDYFEVGNSKMQYPGDQNGAAEEVVNCRCTLKFIK